MKLTIGIACDGHKVQLNDCNSETLVSVFINQEEPERWPTVLQAVLKAAGCEHIEVETEEYY